MRWAIEIRCTQLERRNLADLLAPLGLVLIEESPHVAFTSDKINLDFPQFPGRFA